MCEKPKKKQIVWQQYIAMLFFLLIGAFCGFIMGKVIGQNFEEKRPIWATLLITLGLFVSMYAAIIIHLIIHETGHLVIAGTGGQCLMAPPDMADGKIPVRMYNLGGSLLNIIASAIFLFMYFLSVHVPFLSAILLFFTVIGFIMASMNGVPMRMGTVNNDGYNAFVLTRSSEAMRSFWVQMKVNEQMAKGIRLKDMSDEWFAVPSDEAMKNSMVAVMGVFACNRLMEAEQFETADKFKSQFEKCAKTYPYQNDVQSERKLMEIAEKSMI